MRGIIRVLLGAGLIIALTKCMSLHMHLDTALFIHDTSFQPIDRIDKLLSSVDCDDLTFDDVRRLASFVGASPKLFMKHYVVIC